MKPLRKHLALSIDGGGIKGVIATRALMALEKALGEPLVKRVGLSAGTSTGSIISAGIAAGLSAEQLYNLYTGLGTTIFKSSWRSLIFPLSRYRYEPKPLIDELTRILGDRKLGDFWTNEPHIDLVMTSFDVVANHTCFIKSWKPEYKDWPVVQAIMASSSVPTFFPVVNGRYVDGGVGSYANPCYLAAYEARYYLNWDPAETTLISLGTGRDPHTVEPNQVSSWFAWNWLYPMLGAFLESANEQQFGLTSTFFQDIDFRRFQVDTLEPIGMEDADKIPQLTQYGEQMAQKILNDQWEQAPTFKARATP